MQRSSLRGSSSSSHPLLRPLLMMIIENGRILSLNTSTKYADGVIKAIISSSYVEKIS
ncbi:hypothetical protein SETIT_4G004000v2 [Setaria italica]|uniref:Uncharacterized protein n=1 Tax=Setaria italica TaxID=4555 RepID=A0A368QP84_SETIT|nr:hypothetical protein SETIT_4G004000v2 [Setaria italica]